ncbi:BON domain-containing protein [Actinoplanes sp. RD1]|uniref:BON domain-containing protein n=1 Tax=Actinoplanes sp. RD1 TaxID=3064538 RepID=UPI002740769F|nr:BON domain-containing protein [Actinoplanes sp. RD1]
MTTWRVDDVDELGRLVGIVTRSDLLKVHLRQDSDLRRAIAQGVLRPFLTEANDARADVDDGMVTLAGHVDRWPTADLATRLTRHVPGVVSVVNKITYDWDDRNTLDAGVAFGVA